MPLKDWEKTGENEWHKFSKNGKRLSSGKFYDGIAIVKTINGDYIVDSYYRKFDHKYKEGELKTLPQALSFAKKYMRKN